MGKFYDRISEDQRKFMQEQSLFFTASAALNGHVNLSPKGYDTFRLIDANTVAYLDLTGSGNETSAHIEENGRLTIMFCSFSSSPMILRLYGHAQVIGEESIGMGSLYRLISAIIRTTANYRTPCRKSTNVLRICGTNYAF